MELYQKIRKFILEESFKMQVGSGYVDIVNYTKLRKIEHNEIVVETKSKVIRIIGKNLAIQKLLNEEVFISGTILKIDLGSDVYE